MSITFSTSNKPWVLALQKSLNVYHTLYWPHENITHSIIGVGGAIDPVFFQHFWKGSFWRLFPWHFWKSVFPWHLWKGSEETENPVSCSWVTGEGATEGHRWGEKDMPFDFKEKNDFKDKFYFEQHIWFQRRKRGRPTDEGDKLKRKCHLILWYHNIILWYHPHRGNISICI